MAFRTRNTKLWASTLPESPYNTAPATGADFEALVSQNPFYYLPTLTKTSDAGQIGTGSPFPTHYCNDYWTQTGLSLVTQQSLFDIYGRLWLRAFGGAVTDAAAGTGTKHTAQLQSDTEGSQLPGTTCIVENGPEKVLATGLVVATATLGKTRRERPTLGFELAGTGKHVNQHAITGLPAYAPTGGCPKSGIVVKYTDTGSTVVDLGAAGCNFVDLQIALNNNLLLDDRCPSDSELEMPIGSGAKANVISRVLRQEQSLSVVFTFLLQNTNPEYIAYLTNVKMTNLQIAVQGGVIGVGPAVHELGAIIPKFQFTNISPTDNEGNAAYTLAVEAPIVESSPADLPSGYVINEIATNFE